MIDDRLAALDERIERLVTDPDAVRAPWVRLARPLLARLGYQAEVKIAATQLLLEQLRVLGENTPDYGKLIALQKLLQAAVEAVRPAHQLR